MSLSLYACMVDSSCLATDCHVTKGRAVIGQVSCDQKLLLLPSHGAAEHCQV